MKARRPRKKPFLTKNHVESRLAWAKKYQDWTVVQWERVLFSDESNIEIFPDAYKQFVRRRAGEALSSNCTIPTVKHGGGCVKFWACFGNYNPGVVFFIEENLTGKLYRDILQHQMIPTAHRLIGQDFIFQEDNAPH